MHPCLVRQLLASPLTPKCNKGSRSKRRSSIEAAAGSVVSVFLWSYCPPARAIGKQATASCLTHCATGTRFRCRLFAIQHHRTGRRALRHARDLRGQVGPRDHPVDRNAQRCLLYARPRVRRRGAEALPASAAARRRPPRPKTAGACLGRMTAYMCLRFL